MKVFLSWSGIKSNKVATAYKNWLPEVIKGIFEEDIFISSEDIDKGTRWQTELATQLESSDFGIVCLTAENTGAPWLQFEAGALSKKGTSRVYTFLFDLNELDTKNPLIQFQSTKFEKDDILKLVKSLNEQCEKKVSKFQIEKIFETSYASLEKELNAIETPTEIEIRQYCIHPDELGCGRLKIEQELDNIKKSGVIKVFENQSCAVRGFKEDHDNLEVKTTHILGIRGDNFVNEGEYNWSSIIPIDSYKMTILGNPNNFNMIMNRYEAQKLRKDETPERFIERYRKAMLHTQNVLKDYPNNTMYLHDESDLPFRMIFIEDYLFLSTYDKKKIAPEAEVIKIYKSSTLYSMCEEYFNKIKNSIKK